jgi:hypothetical protein
MTSVPQVAVGARQVQQEEIQQQSKRESDKD